jgi:multiple sugar transport system substrate-binding protein
MRPSRLILFAIIISTAAILLWPASRSSADKTTLLFTVWGMPFEDRLFLDRYARVYEELNPGIRIDYQRYTDDIEMKYNAWHTQGRGADVMRLRVTAYHGMVARGMLEPLDAWMTGGDGLSSKQFEEFPPGLIGIIRVEDHPEGTIFALPEDNAQFGLFYNRALIDAWNGAHPEDPISYPSAEWTWADLRAAAKRLTVRDASGHLEVRGLDFAVWSWPFLAFFAQAGGQIWSEDGLACLIDSPAGVEALEFLRAMQRDGSFEPQLSGYTSGTGPDALFAAGRTALFLDGSWRVPDLENRAPGLDFAVAPLPRGKVPAVVSGCVLWGISEHSEHKAEAWAFLKWLVDREQALTYWDTLRVAPPANLGVVASDEFMETRGVLRDSADPSRGYEVLPMPREKFEDRAAWLRYAVTPDPATGRAPGFVPVNAYQSELEVEIQSMLNEYLRPGSTLEARAALGAVVARVHSIIDRDRAAKGLGERREMR